MESYDYGNWITAIIHIGLFLFFALSFLVPRKRREWHATGIYSAFIIALFTEMFGFPLTIYLLSPLVGSLLSFEHSLGHLLGVALGGDVWLMVVCQLGGLLMASGFILVYLGWRKVHRAKGELITDGIYKYVRHPQYLGLVIITVGALVQWPTIVTFAMWPILAVMYYRLARKEEKEMESRFGGQYVTYRQRVSMFWPRLATASRTAKAKASRSKDK